jgi:hypothetical protein
MSPVSRRASGRMAVVVAVLLLAVSSRSPVAHGASPGPVRVRASAAFAPCLEPALAAFSRESGIATVLDVNEPDPPGEADVVVGDDAELQRLLEGGTADIPSSFDLGYIPWVFVVPERSPESVSALASADRVYLPGGKVGLVGRVALKAVSAERVRVSSDPKELRQASYALVPRSLAGPGEHRPAGVRALVATAAMITAAPHPAGARQLLAFLKSPRGRAVLSSWLDASETRDSGAGTPPAVGEAVYAVSVVDWWLPGCSLQHNGYNDPQQVLGPPDAVNLGGKDNYQGMMSLGQGGYVTVDMGASAIDGPGGDIRVFQTTAREPVTVYASTSAQGPFTLIGLRYDCGSRSQGLFSNHCDFDLHDGGLAEARYFRVEDGEIYPCLAGGTITEGADIDAVQILNLKP